MMRSKALAEANSAKQRLAAAKQGGLSSTQELALAKERALLDKKIQQQLEHNRKQANMVEVHTVGWPAEHAWHAQHWTVPLHRWRPCT